MAFLDNIQIVPQTNSLVLPAVSRSVFESCVYTGALDLDFLEILGGLSVDAAGVGLEEVLFLLHDKLTPALSKTRFGQRLSTLTPFVQPIVALRAGWALAHVAELSQKRVDAVEYAREMSVEFPPHVRTSVGQAMDRAVEKLVQPKFTWLRGSTRSAVRA